MIRDEFKLKLVQHTNIDPLDIIGEKDRFVAAKKAFETGKVLIEELDNFKTIYQAEALGMSGATKEEALMIETGLKYKLFRSGLSVDTISKNNPFHIIAVDTNKLHNPSIIEKITKFDEIVCLRQPHIDDENFESECLGESSTNFQTVEIQA